MEKGLSRRTVCCPYTESSKMNIQKWAREVTHLGLVSYQDGKPHTMENSKLNKDVVALLASKDNMYAEQIGDTGNTNLINTLSTNNNIKIIEQNGAPKVAQKLREIRDSRNGEENKNIDTKEMLNSIDLEV